MQHLLGFLQSTWLATDLEQFGRVFSRAVRLSDDLPDRPASAAECGETITEVFPVIELHHFVLPEPGPAAGG